MPHRYDDAVDDDTGYNDDDGDGYHTYGAYYEYDSEHVYDYYADGGNEHGGNSGYGGKHACG